MKSIVYLDNNATTPMDPRVFQAMKPYFLDSYGNAASRHHGLGCDAAKAVETARQQVAEVIRADPREIVFTSGATESVNLAIKGMAASSVNAEKGNHIVTARTEHAAVLDSCRRLSERGWEVTYLPVDGEGCVDLQQVADAITDRTVLVSLMHANNEIGVLHPIEQIGRLCKERGVLFHTDATQSYGKEEIDVEACGIDLLSLSAHKLYGPKGCGALCIRRRNPRVRCEPMQDGGGHERGLRSGTLNVPGIVGLGAAAEICNEEMAVEQQRIRGLRDLLQKSLMSRIVGGVLNGHPRRRLANTLNISFEGAEGEELMKRMPDIAISSSSACTSALRQPSHVLGALGADDDRMQQSLRFSLGRFTTREEIDHTVRRVEETVASVRS